MTVQGKSKLMEGGTKLGFPLDCHIFKTCIYIHSVLKDRQLLTQRDLRFRSYFRD